MLDGIKVFFKKFGKKEEEETTSKDAAKERLHLVLMQDRANVSVDYLDMMKQEIVDVIKKYIDVDESEMDVRLTTQTNEDGTNGAPALYANIPIISIKNEKKMENNKNSSKIENVNQVYGKNSIEEDTEKKAIDTKMKNKDSEKDVEMKKYSENDKMDKEENKEIKKEVKKVAKKISPNKKEEIDTKEITTKKIVSKPENKSTTKQVSSTSSAKKSTTATKKTTSKK